MECAICSDEPSASETYTTECQHNFHLKCLIYWLSRENSRSRCPMCRKTVTLYVPPKKLSSSYNEFIRLPGVRAEDNVVNLDLEHPNWLEHLNQLIEYSDGEQLNVEIGNKLACFELPIMEFVNEGNGEIRVTILPSVAILLSQLETILHESYAEQCSGSVMLTSLLHNSSSHMKIKVDGPNITVPRPEKGVARCTIYINLAINAELVKYRCFLHRIFLESV